MKHIQDPANPARTVCGLRINGGTLWANARCPNGVDCPDCSEKAPTYAECQEAGDPAIHDPGDHPDGPMAEFSTELSPRQLETLAAPAALELPDGEDFAVDPAGLFALEFDASREDCPVVLRLHPTLAALLETFKR